MTRRKLLGMLAGLPLIGRWFGEPEAVIQPLEIPRHVYRDPVVVMTTWHPERSWVYGAWMTASGLDESTTEVVSDDDTE